jgi:hypothetical protein
MIARMDANHEKRMARMDAWLTDIKNDRKETMACLEKTEGRRRQASLSGRDT